MMARASFLTFRRAAGMQIKNSATGLPVAKSLAVAPVDVDNDGWMDLVVANDTVPEFSLPQPARRDVQGNRRALGDCVRRLRPDPRRDGH